MRKVGGNTGNRGKGRPKGAPNKSTAAVKEALALTFDGRGGVAALQRWSDENPTEFYKLWAKMLPHEVSGPDGGPIALGGVIRWGKTEIPL